MQKRSLLVFECKSACNRISTPTYEQVLLSFLCVQEYTPLHCITSFIIQITLRWTGNLHRPYIHTWQIILWGVISWRQTFLLCPTMLSYMVSNLYYFPPEGIITWHCVNWPGNFIHPCAPPCSHTWNHFCNGKTHHEVRKTTLFFTDLFKCS